MHIQTKRLISELIFFIIFLTLMVIGLPQVWMAFIFLSIFLAAFFGRYYCGWICPIYTMIRIGNFVGKKLGTQRKGIPSFFKKKALRIVVLIIFLGALGYTIYTMIQGQKFPLPIIIIALGVLVTIFVNENTWHRYLCPWGILLSFTGRFSKRGMNVRQDGCIACGRCYRVCPADAIEFRKKAEIKSAYCLQCFRCHDVCPVNVIGYRKNV